MLRGTTFFTSKRGLLTLYGAFPGRLLCSPTHLRGDLRATLAQAALQPMNRPLFRKRVRYSSSSSTHNSIPDFSGNVNAP